MALIVSVIILLIAGLFIAIFAAIKCSLRPTICPKCKSEMRELFNVELKKIECECPHCGYTQTLK